MFGWSVIFCIFVTYLWRAAPTQCSPLCVSYTMYNSSSEPLALPYFYVTQKWNVHASFHTHKHKWVFTAYLTLSRSYCHLKFAFLKDINSRLTKTLKLLWRGLVLVLSLALLSFLFLLSPPLKGIETLLPCYHATESEQRETNKYFKKTFSMLVPKLGWLLLCVSAYLCQKINTKKTILMGNSCILILLFA